MFTKRLPEEPSSEQILFDMLSGVNDEDPEDILKDENDEKGSAEETDNGMVVWYQDGNRPSVKPTSRRSFVFHPSFLDSYFDLLQINPLYGKIFIESLMLFGVDSYDEVPNIPIIKLALRGPYAVIDRSYCNFVKKQHEAAHEEYRTKQAIQAATQIRSTVRIMEKKLVEWQRKMKREWPFLIN